MLFYLFIYLLVYGLFEIKSRIAHNLKKWSILMVIMSTKTWARANRQISKTLSFMARFSRRSNFYIRMTNGFLKNSIALSNLGVIPLSAHTFLCKRPRIPHSPVCFFVVVAVAPHWQAQQYLLDLDHRVTTNFHSFQFNPQSQQRLKYIFLMVLYSVVAITAVAF